jgi:hypothetical protein
MGMADRKPPIFHHRRKTGIMRKDGPDVDSDIFSS